MIEEILGALVFTGILMVHGFILYLLIKFLIKKGVIKIDGD